jgi:hypothetical protein
LPGQRGLPRGHRRLAVPREQQTGANLLPLPSLFRQPSPFAQPSLVLVPAPGKVQFSSRTFHVLLTAVTSWTGMPGQKQATIIVPILNNLRMYRAGVLNARARANAPQPSRQAVEAPVAAIRTPEAARCDNTNTYLCLCRGSNAKILKIFAFIGGISPRRMSLPRRRGVLCVSDSNRRPNSLQAYLTGNPVSLCRLKRRLAAA